MTIHHFDILGCPFCGHLYRSPVHGSYNTFSAKYWSDGVVTGGVPQNYPILKCQNPECSGMFFKDDAVVVGKTINTDNLRLPKELLEKYPPYPPEWDDAIHIHFTQPKFNDLCDFIEKNPEIDRERKRILVKESIIRYNDNYRENDKWEPSVEDQSKMNECLKMMVQFIEGSDKEEDQLMMAECYRELGEFDKALAVLKSINNPKHKETKEVIFTQAKQKHSRLFDLNRIAVKKEYRCSNCKKSVFIFDLEKLKTKLTYGIIFCASCQNIISTNLTMANPVNYYNRNLFQRLFVKYNPIVPVRVLKCPLCDSIDVISFDIEHDKCPFCHTGNFEQVEWDW